MSGPIVRKYGFPNFEQIFGKKELEHGTEAPPPEPPKGDGEARAGEGKGGGRGGPDKKS